MKKGKSLEELFIDSRTTGDTPDFPMINTKEGLAINEMMYRFLTPYLNYNYSSTNNFSAGYVRRGDKFEEQVCRIESSHNDFMKLLKQMEDTAAVTNEASSGDFQNLREALEEYRKYQRGYEETLRQKFDVEKEIKDIFKKQFPNDQKAWEAYAPLDFLSLDLDSSITYYEGLAERDKGKKYISNMWDSTVAQLKKQKEISEYVKANLSQNGRDKLKAQDEAFAKSGVTYKLSSRISSEAKKVYESLYNKNKSAESNPCRDFVL